MKKRVICLAMALFAALLFAGCGSGDPLPTPPEPGTGSGNTDSPGPGGDNPSGPGSTTSDSYTVSLVANDKKYVPSIAMSAIWTGTDGSKYASEFDRNGIATMKGNATGDFSVTLTALPAGYSYNPNIYTATASNKEVVIDLVSCLSVAVKGEEPSVMGATTLAAGNVYRATLKSAEDKVWFLIDPCDFETWCSVAENKVSPRLTGYIGNAASGYYNPESEQRVEGGGPSGSFTENISFRWNEGGSLSFFVLQADSQKGYPVDIDFKTSAPVGGTGGGGQTDVSAKVGDPTLLKVIEPEGAFRYTYTDTGRVCKADRFKLFPRGTTDSAGNEGDDYWHFYDAATDTYGAILFAKISKPCGILDVPFTDEKISPIAYGRNYREFLEQYAEYCNKDGAHPLTEELRLFFQGYAVNERYFNDGNGWAEMRGLQSAEDDQWLFCVGYYA